MTTLAETLLDRRRLIAGMGGLCLTALPVRAQTAGITPFALSASRVNIYVRGADSAATPALAYNATVPGPLLRYKQGDDIRVRFTNELDQPTAIHWQGYRIDNAMDGVPDLTQKPIASGESYDYAFKARDAGTFLYRPYAGANTASQLEQGLSGVLVVDEAQPVEVDQDHVFIFDDWTFDADGKPGSAYRDTPDGLKPSGLAPLYTLNGKTAESIAVRANQRLRLRLVNATGGRFITLRSVGEMPVLMALDGQPCEPFLLRDSTIGLAPGQRADLFLDVPAGADQHGLELLRGKDDWARVIDLKRGNEPPQRAVQLGEPKSLPPNIAKGEMNFRNAVRAEIRLTLPQGYKPGQPWLVNGKPLAGIASEAPLFKVKRGTVIQLAFVNETPTIATAHLHGHVARLLDGMDDGWKPFWIDTAMVLPSGTTRIAFIADNPGKWLIRTQLFDQPPRIMGPWFEVV